MNARDAVAARSAALADLELGFGEYDPATFEGVYMRGERDCVNACLASALGLELDELPQEWLPWSEWREWLWQRGLALDAWWLDQREGWRPTGWWIGGCSATVEGVDYHHAILFFGDGFVWDPALGFGPRHGTLGSTVVSGYALVPFAE